VFTPHSAENIERAQPDLVIIGNVIRRVNPEAAAVRELGIPQMSFPAAFGALVAGNRHSIVVTGTHGKTTTSAMMAHVLADAGLDPTFLVGGVTHNYTGNFRLGSGEHVVIEGDEYDTAYFDRAQVRTTGRAQRPDQHRIDHADIYTDMAHYESAYERSDAAGERLVRRERVLPRAVEIARSHSPRRGDVRRDRRCRLRARDVQFGKTARGS
jgi:UDP-N-acetylmuramate: L-alanyl-gamma-D-glutamyl-meso-diaminopimelate ligase